jgi:hypothetical protein
MSGMARFDLMKREVAGASTLAIFLASKAIG